MKIAIAGGDDAIRQLLRGGEGFPGDEVISLDDPGAYRAAATDLDLRVLIWDLARSRRPGADLCRQIRRRDAAGPYVSIIAIIDEADEPARAEAFASGSDAILVRPWSGDEFGARLAVARRVADHEASLRNRADELEQTCRTLQARVETLAEVASSDALTGLRNRRFFGESLDTQFSLARRKGLPMSLVMIDVDQFKAFNDQFGHPAGDEVLREVGLILRSCVRDHDIVARYGGEEFAILLPATEEGECYPLVDRLRFAVAHHPWPLRRVTISLGISTLRPTATQPSDLIDQADRALYYSKSMGRNRATHSRDLPDLIAEPLHGRVAGGPLISHPVASR